MIKKIFFNEWKIYFFKWLKSIHISKIIFFLIVNQNSLLFTPNKWQIGLVQKPVLGSISVPSKIQDFVLETYSSLDRDQLCGTILARVMTITVLDNDCQIFHSPSMVDDRENGPRHIRQCLSVGSPTEIEFTLCVPRSGERLVNSVEKPR